MSKTIVLVSCVKSKRSRPSPARELYTSTLFQGSSAYAEKVGDRWFILSAKYGLLESDQVVAPYEKTLNKMPAAERRAWAKAVIKDLQTRVEPGDEVIFLAGKRYRENLIEPLERMGCRISIPMEGLPFGMQLRWLKKQLEDPKFSAPDNTQNTTIRYANPQRKRSQRSNMSLADQIRNHVIEDYIEPARKAGRSTATVTAKRVHSDLKLKNRYPAVCSALDGDIFKDQAKIVVQTRSGPRQSPTATWIIKIL